MDSSSTINHWRPRRGLKEDSKKGDEAIDDFVSCIESIEVVVDVFVVVGVVLVVVLVVWCSGGGCGVVWCGMV